MAHLLWDNYKVLVKVWELVTSVAIGKAALPAHSTASLVLHRRKLPRGDSHLPVSYLDQWEQAGQSQSMNTSHASLLRTRQLLQL
jgi:hypothetical protein